jgi:hypothetical protein
MPRPSHEETLLSEGLRVVHRFVGCARGSTGSSRAEARERIAQLLFSQHGLMTVELTEIAEL